MFALPRAGSAFLKKRFNDWAVIVDVSCEYVGDSNYFKALAAVMEDPRAPGALMGWLMARGLSHIEAGAPLPPYEVASTEGASELSRRR